MTEAYKRELLAKAAAKNLSPSEQQEIELAMLEDAFLKEAYLGYHRSDSAQDAVLRTLHGQLSARVGKSAKLRFLIPPLAVAAVLSLLVAISLWNFWPKNSSEPLAAVVQETRDVDIHQDEKMDVVFSPLEPDDEEVAKPRGAVDKQARTPAAQVQSQSKTQESITSSADQDDASLEIENTAEQEEAFVGSGAVSDSVQEKFRMASGRVLKHDLLPLPQVRLAYLSSDPIGYSDSLGAFAFTVDPAEKFLQFEAEGYQPLIMSLDKLQKRDLVMQAPSHKFVNDSFAQKRTRRSTESHVEHIADLDEATDFQTFLEQNRQYPVEAATARKTGNVLITFTLDQKGRPDLFYLQSSPHTSCTAEAIRLLREGPRWIKEENQDYYEVIVPCFPF